MAAYFRDLLLCAGLDSNKFVNVAKIPVNYIDGEGKPIHDLESYTEFTTIFDKQESSYNNFKFFVEVANEDVHSERISKSLFNGVTIQISKCSVRINPDSPNLLNFLRG